jgi:hypothetical protein
MSTTVLSPIRSNHGPNQRPHLREGSTGWPKPGEHLTIEDRPIDLESNQTSTEWTAHTELSGSQIVCPGLQA